MRVTLTMNVETEQWKNAAIVASNLSELELARGEVAAAVAAGEQSVTYADRSGDASWQMASRTAQADVLHQAGGRAESRGLFEDAETRQAARQPEYPRLYSLQGFQYCDLLQAEAERAAWQRWLRGEAGLGETLAAAVADCDAVGERASQTQEWAIRNRLSLLTIALDHLTLARAALYKADFAVPIPAPACQHITAAVDGLRKANAMHYLPRGYLTRAWLRCLSDDEAGVRADLEDAWDIAERGPMPLFQADVQLTRARLFRDRVALAEARRLIEKHGYHRRDGELADAEAAAVGWDLTPRPPLPSHTLPPGEGAPPPARVEEAVRDQVFISYSHKDKRLQEELLMHLAPYLRSGSVTAWSDQQISSGSKWFTEIQAALSRTSVAVLLVSPGFLASDFIHKHELGPLLAEARAGGVQILWVPLRPSSFEETDLKVFQAVSPPDEPLAQMTKGDRDAAWVRVCKEIKRAVNA